MQTVKKATTHFGFISKFLMALSALFISAITFAQEKAELDVNVNTDSGGGFFASPWVWVVGIAVFILLLVALLRGGSRREV